MTQPDRPPFDWSCRRISLALALVAGLATILTLADPGITVDEPLDVRPGRAYLTALRTHGFRFFSRDVVTRVYSDNKEHPPLGRWLLGIASTIGEPFEVMLLGGPDPLGIYVVSGRLAPALAFALLVGSIASECGRRYGRAGAFAGGFALLVMPRVFAHAHLGALDLFIAAAWCIALIRAERALESGRPIRGLALAGIFWGLALLIKIHAWLLPPIILVRALVRLGPRKAAPAFAGWTLIGLAVFFAGWPWLWYDSIERLRAYLGTGVERVSIYVQYFGHVYRDRDVPWHFPWFYFVATVPVGLHALGITGLIGALRARDSAALTYAGAIAAILAVFSTNVPVYDGERLFLLVFPLWAILVGRGFSTLRLRCWSSFPVGTTKIPSPLEGEGRVGGSSLQPRPNPPPYLPPQGGREREGLGLGRSCLTAFLLAQALGVIWVHPYGLSYYNLLVGGLPGAERLGLELAYWSDSVDRPLLRRLATEALPGATAALAPTLAPDQGKIASTRELIRRRLILDDEDAASRDDWLVVYRRSGYWKEPVRRLLDAGEIVEVRSRQGVWLSAIVRRRKPGTPPVQRPVNP